MRTSVIKVIFFPILILTGTAKRSVAQNFLNGPECVALESADVNHDLVINILDMVYLINNVYKGGAAPECVVW